MRQRLQLGRTSWRNIGLAFSLWLAYWAVLVTTLERVMGALNVLPKFVLRLPFQTPMQGFAPRTQWTSGMSFLSAPMALECYGA